MHREVSKKCLFIDDPMDHNTRFAKSLGFFEDAPWSLETPFNPSEEQIPDADMEDSGRFSYLANDQEGSMPPKPPVEG